MYGPLLKVFYPVVVVVNAAASAVLKILGLSDSSGESDSLSREELRTVLSASDQNISKQHVDILLNVLDLEEVTVNDIMVPRNDIYGVDLASDWQSISQCIALAPHSRVLVYRESVDQAVGILLLRKVLKPTRTHDLTLEDIESQVQEPYFIPENTPLTVQLLKFQRAKRRVGWWWMSTAT